MAIKEFVIGGSEYIQGGYYALGYFATNTARTGLSCSITKIRNVEVVTGVYYQDNYIDGTYFHRNSIEAGLIADAMIVQEAQVSLQGYIQEGYYPSGYYRTAGSGFTLTAELEQIGEDVFAQGTWSSTSEVTVQIGVIRTAESTMSVVFQQTAVISHIEGADLFAFSEASIAIQVNIIKSTNVEVSTVFNIAVDAVRGVYVSAQADSLVTLENTASVLRGLEAAVDAAFSLNADITNYKQTTVSLQSSIGIDTSAVKSTSTQVACQVESSLQSTISHIEGADLQAFTNADLAVEATITRNFTSNNSIETNITVDAVSIKTLDIVATSISNQTVSISKIVPLVIDCQSAFVPSVNCVAITNTFAVLESLASIFVDNSRTRNVIIEQTVNATVDSQVSVVTDTETAIQTSTNLDCTVKVTRDLDISLASEVQVSAINYRIKQFSIEETSAFSPSISCNVTVNPFANLESAFSFNINLSKTITFNVDANAQSSLTVNTNVISSNSSTMVSQSSLTALGIRSVRFITTNVQGQIISPTGNILQTDIYPNYSQVSLAQPA